MYTDKKQEFRQCEADTGDRQYRDQFPTINFLFAACTENQDPGDSEIERKSNNKRSYPCEEVVDSNPLQKAVG